MTTPSIRDQLRQTLVEQIAPAFQFEVPLERQREALEAISAETELPAGTSIERTELAGRPAEWIEPAGADPRRALLHLHGGGYVMGSCGSHRGLSASIARATACRVLLPEYRLAPEHPFPAALDDAQAIYRALLDRGLSPADIVILGDSAGGGLALATLLALRDAGTPLPAAAVLLSPWTDMTFSGESLATRAMIDPWISPTMLEPFSKLYRVDLDPDDPRISPLFGDFSGLPPMLVQVGDQEILLSDSTRLSERAEAAGVELQLEIGAELWHVYQLFAPALPDANEALTRIGAFVRAKLAPT